MAGWIVVVRRRSHALREARFAVFIDGVRVAKLDRDATRGFQVGAGVHRVRVKQWGYPSKTLEVSVADGETVIVRTRTRFWGNYLTTFSSTLIGGNAFWMCAQKVTPTNTTMFSIGVVGVVVLLWSRAGISLRPDPTQGP